MLARIQSIKFQRGFGDAYRDGLLLETNGPSQTVLLNATQPKRVLINTVIIDEAGIVVTEIYDYMDVPGVSIDIKAMLGKRKDVQPMKTVVRKLERGTNEKNGKK